MYFFFSKFIPLILLPLSLSLIIIFLALLFNKKKYIISSLLILYFFGISFISNVLFTISEKPWKKLSIKDVPEADYIVVLSGGELFLSSNSLLPEWEDRDRFLSGVKLFKSNKAKYLIFTNAPLENDLSTGNLYIREAIELGIDRRYIYTTPLVRNTEQEAKYVSNFILNRPNTNSILLVTSAMHMNRAKKLFERNDINVYPFPVDFKSSHSVSRVSFFKSPYNWIPNSKALHDSSIVLRELLGRIRYRSW